MGNPIEIKIVNLPQIKAAFKKAPYLMTRNLNTAITKTIFDVQGKEIAEYSTLGINKVTRELSKSITAGRYQTNLRGEVGPNVTGSPGTDLMPKSWHGINHYGVFVHDGTKYMRARPFLANAVEKAQPNVDKFFTQAVDDTLRSIGRMV